jgi:MEDS: MEthanogen/methylotroph, DcmR Sensory domain
MNPSGAALLANPQPCGHIVYPYTDESHVAEAVCLFASSGLRKGEVVILVMSAGHCKPIRHRLEAEGFNLAHLEKAGLLVCKDAKDLLSTFLADGKLDEVGFKNAIGNLIEKAKMPRGSRPGRHVRVFGEMVDLMWKDDLQNTHRLEELWNEVIEAHSVPLLCAYSLAGIKPSESPAALLSCHSHTIAATV